MSDTVSNDAPEVIPWERFQKEAERGLDISVYITSMNAHILNQRDEINRLRPAAESWESYVAARERKGEKGATQAPLASNQEVERAFGVLETLGIPRERARSVPNGIIVLDQRYAREIAALRAEVKRLNELVADHEEARRTAGETPSATGVSPSPLAQAILERVTEVNVGLFLTGAIDHIEKGGNTASGQVELRDGTLVELRMQRVPAVKTPGGTPE